MTKIKQIYNKIINLFENPNEPLMGANKMILQHAGFFSSDNKYLNYFNFSMQIIMNLLLLSQIIDVCLLLIIGGDEKRIDINLFLTNLKFTCITLITILKCNAFVAFKNKWSEIFNYIKEADLEERVIVHEEPNNIVKKYTRYNRVLNYSYWIMVGIMAITTIHLIILPVIINKVSTRLDENVLPCPYILNNWVPFDKNTSPGCWIIMLWHCVMAYYAAVIVGSYDPTILNIMKFFEYKLKLLQYRCTLLYKYNEDITVEEFVSRVGECHRQHTLYIKNVKLFNSLHSPVIFVYVLICSLLICCIAVQLISGGAGNVEKVVNFDLMVFTLVQLYVFCFHSNNVFYQSLEVSYGPYCCDWWLLDVRRRRMVLLLSGKLRQTVVFTAGPFTDLKISTFIGILKGAYSYYTLLRK